VTHRGPFQPLQFCDSVLCPAETGNMRDEGLARQLPSKRGQEAVPWHQSLSKHEKLQKERG